jgi:hypothetical protein
MACALSRSRSAFTEAGEGGCEVRFNVIGLSFGVRGRKKVPLTDESAAGL